MPFGRGVKGGETGEPRISAACEIPRGDALRRGPNPDRGGVNGVAGGCVILRTCMLVKLKIKRVGVGNQVLPNRVESSRKAKK